jgi:hypothetical protein
MLDTATRNQHPARQHVGARQTKPPRAQLPEIDFLEVATLQVDYTYQHRPYVHAIENLNRDFNPALSGFILVNIRDGGTAWIIDGQTRMEVHKTRGLQWIRSEIMRGLTAAQEAEIYLIKCINTQRLPVDSFLAEYKAGRPQALLIQAILKEHDIEVESYATRHGASTGQAVVSCIASLKRTLREDKDGDFLRTTLDLIIATWGYHPSGLGGQYIEMMHGLVRRYGDEIDRKGFIGKLSGYPVLEIREMARALRGASTPQMSLRSATERKIIELYNLGRQTRRIGSAT